MYIRVRQNTRAHVTTIKYNTSLVVVLIGNYLNQKLFYVVQFHICSMYLTITMVTCMLVLLILDGLLDTLMLSMVPLVTVLLLYSLRAFLPILTLVSELLCEEF